MYIAQQLYEGIDLGKEGTVGLISYIRTDSTRISDEAVENTNRYIKENFGEKYLPDKRSKYTVSQSPRMHMKLLDLLLLNELQNK